MGSRAGLAALVAASTFAFAQTSAWACEDPQGQRATAAAGDPVEFFLPATGEGARYELAIDGGVVHTGKDRDSEPGVRGSFAMPDLGSRTREVTVAIAVEEKDGADCSGTLVVDYRGRAERREPPPPSRQPAPPPAPPAPPAAPAPAPSALPAPVAPRARNESAPTSSPIVKGVRRTLARFLPVRGRPAAPRPAAKRRRAKKAPKRRKARRHTRKVTPLAIVPDSPRPAPPDVSRVKADLSGGEFPGLGYSVAWRLLVGTALGGFALMGLVALRVRVRRRTQ